MTKEDAPRVQNSAWPALARKNKGPEMTEESANFMLIINRVKGRKNLPVGESEDHGRGFSGLSVRSGSS